MQRKLRHLNADFSYSGVASLVMIAMTIYTFVNYSHGKIELYEKDLVAGLPLSKERQRRALQYLDQDGLSPYSDGVEYVEEYIDIDGTKIYFVAAIRVEKNKPPPRFPILMLHAPPFDAKVWKAVGTMHFLAKNGYYPIALDLPGFGKSIPDRYKGEREDFLKKFVNAVPRAEKPVIIVPSASGLFGLGYMFKFQMDVRGLIAIAPANVFKVKHYSSLHMPTLIFYGSEDEDGETNSKLISHVPNSTIIRIENGLHPAYFDNLVLFHAETKKFLDNIYDGEVAPLAKSYQNITSKQRHL